MKTKFLFFSSCALLCMIFQGHAQEHKPLEYDVAVTARIVPVFAVDSRGNPVFDLKSDEIVFYVNGKPVPFQFERYWFEHKEEAAVRQGAVTRKGDKVTDTGTGAGETTISEPGKRRVVFVVIDSILNSVEGLKRSKRIVAQLIQDRSPSRRKGNTMDDFVILENTPGGGLKYIIGPESDKEKLLTALETVNDIPERFNRGLFINDSKNQTGGVDLSDNKKYRFSKNRKSERLRYRNVSLKFARSLSQLKHALKTISRPKIVFLVSEGIQKGSFISTTIPQGEFTESTPNSLDVKFDALTHLKKVARAVNEGGSVLYSINPRKMEFENLRDDAVSGQDSMNYVARESGGKYFEGSDPGVIVKNIRKTTAAYYELNFMVTPEMGKSQKLKFQCRRKGVRLHSIKRLTSERPYPKMTPVEKKLFALNIAHQGTWSRMVAKSQQWKYQRIDSRKTGKKVTHTYEIKIPQRMRNKKVDIFVLRVGKGKDKIDFGLNRKKASSTEILKVQWRKRRSHYYVIIEPGEPFCIYNRLSN